MKRDMDIVRDLLLRSEATEGQVSVKDPLETYHVRIMLDAGLIEGRISEEITADAPRYSYINNLTWAGHDFLDAARNDTVWRTAKEKVLKPGASWTFDLLKEILKALAKQQLAHIGLPDFNA
jgi:hypothetical protein